jgi:hypothetical protein
MKTIYKSCYFSAVTPFSILAQIPLELFLINHQGSPFQVNVNVLGSTNGVSTDFESFNCQMLRKAVKSFSFIGYKI